ncbi:hypothetical protein AGLY_009958 [Aphis glycines]|uniref:Uncharacterized protein n=1 Tax=Aphis glycines TaxID=307491 RepID=A0A6G0THB8_APHGL|nr:hypothetical protein AGLY_009958 [Aphis glycines]
MLEFIKSQKGYNLLVFEGYSFSIHRKREFIDKREDHEHAPDAPGLEPRNVIERIKKASDSTQTTRNIIGEAFSQSSMPVVARLQSCGLKNRYSTDVIFVHEIKKLSVLAFVPVDNVISAFEELINSDYYVENEEDLQIVVDYFEDTWIGRLTRGGSPRTNNVVEGWHRAFISALGANHVTVRKFINMLKREQGLQEVKMEQQIARVPQQKKRRKYKDLDEWLVAVVKEPKEIEKQKKGETERERERGNCKRWSHE